METKILFTASTVSHINNFHLPYLKALYEEGIVVHVAVPGASTFPFVQKTIDLPLEKSMFSVKNLIAAVKLRHRIKQERYALVITHTSLAAFFTRLSLFAVKRRPKVINVTHGYLFTGSKGVRNRILLLAEKMVSGKTDLLLTMNEEDFHAARQYRLGKTVRSIPGIGVPDVTGQKPIPGAKPRDKILLYAAEFSKRKHQELLIRAMPMIDPQVRLVLAGTGTEEESCRTLVKELGLEDRVLMPGYVAQAGQMYANAFAAVTASGSEGLPFNVMEAMLQGVPVIASRVKGHTDLIRDGETGLLFDPDSSEDFANKVNTLLRDPRLYGQIRDNARDNIEKYRLVQVLPQVMAQYRSLL